MFKRSLHFVAGAIMIALATLDIGLFHLFKTLDWRFSDIFVREAAEKRLPDNDIMILNIDEYSLREMIIRPNGGGKWPWPLSVHAQLVEGLLEHKPKAIVFDIGFFNPDPQRRDDENWFNEVIAASSIVYFPYLRFTGNLETSSTVLLAEPANELGFDRLTWASILGIEKTAEALPDARFAGMLPLAINAMHWRTADATYLEDDDGVGRRYNVKANYHGWLIPSLPAAVIRDQDIQLPPDESILLNWFRHPHRTVSYIKMLDSLYSADGPVAPIRNKTIVIGSNAALLHDQKNTPIHSLYPGMAILTTAMDNLKNGDSLSLLPPKYMIMLVAANIIILVLAFRAAIPPLRIGFIQLGFTAIIVLGTYLSVVEYHTVALTLSPMLYGWLFFIIVTIIDFIRERQMRVKAIDTFSRFVDPTVVGNLINADNQLPTQRAEITVLFSDIRNFTTLSEAHTPEEIVSLLNQYFSKQVAVIFNHGGTIDKFIGDAIMAFWGAPREVRHHATQAVDAALDMVDALEAFKQEAGEIANGFDIGIGMHSGPAVVGCIGSSNRLEYTAIGDTVNLASRIEGQTKGRCRILISGETRELTGDRFDYISHGEVQVKGRHKPVELYEVNRKPGTDA